MANLSLGAGGRDKTPRKESSDSWKVSAVPRIYVVCAFFFKFCTSMRYNDQSDDLELDEHDYGTIYIT